MSTTLETIEAEALKLPPSDRSHLVERLLFSLDADAELEEAWAREADRREAELDSGAVEAVPGERAMERLRARLG
jgi:putative addiction module component (TIGR02574 family)